MRNLPTRFVDLVAPGIGVLAEVCEGARGMALRAGGDDNFASLARRKRICMLLLLCSGWSVRERRNGRHGGQKIAKHCSQTLAQNGAHYINALPVTPAKAGVQSPPRARPGGNR